MNHKIQNLLNLTETLTTTTKVWLMATKNLLKFKGYNQPLLSEIQTWFRFDEGKSQIFALHLFKNFNPHSNIFNPFHFRCLDAKLDHQSLIMIYHNKSHFFFLMTRYPSDKTYIYNSLLPTTYFSDPWKFPIFKRPPEFSFSYCSIYLLPIIGKFGKNSFWNSFILS